MSYENFPKRRILAFGDSNTYGYDPAAGRYGDGERWPCVLQRLLGDGCTVLEEGLPGRTAVFDDPISEGLCGLDAIVPCMRTHEPLDTVLILLGTNDTKERFGCSAAMIAKGIARLAEKALHTPAWRGTPDVLVVCPAPIVPAYRTRMFRDEMGAGCDEKAAALAAALRPLALAAGARFADAAAFPGVCVHPLDGMHLTREAHAALAAGLAPLVRAE